MEEPKLLWKPSKEFAQNSNLFKYQNWLSENKGIKTENYTELWEWSIENVADFWTSILEYFKIEYSGSFSKAIEGNMPETHWFKGISLNYAEHAFRNKTTEFPVIIYASETDKPVQVSWQELEEKVSSVSNWLRSKNIKKGDRVAAFVHNGPEALISFLATNSIGAIWSSTSPDFGLSSVLDRFSQIEPKVLICSREYSYNGKIFDKATTIEKLVTNLPSVENLVIVGTASSIKKVSVPVSEFEDLLTNPGVLTFEKVEFEHPIWVLYSSGTTGLPKPITHSCGGVLLEHLKYVTFHNNVKPGDRCFWFTTTGWMMWNYIQASLLAGGTVVLYDGSPVYPTLNTLWKLTEEVGITHFGTSAGYIIANMKSSHIPKQEFNLSSLVSIGSTGSPLPPEGFDWLYHNIDENLWVTSMSGGTDVCSAFVGGNPFWPVYSGEIQCRALGCDLRSFNEKGIEVTSQVGEMVICKPMPSMPVFFWGDVKYERYKESYFEMYEGIWRHGDWIEITEREGVIIYGRSDSTLNRGGVRIGTSEIYRAVDSIEEVKDSIIICLENESGEYFMPLFIVLNDGYKLTSDLIKKLKTTIREFCSPRHVPDEFILIEDVPYTISGKKVETPVKKILMGQKLNEVINKDALKNPVSLNFFKEYRKNLAIFLNK